MISLLKKFQSDIVLWAVLLATFFLTRIPGLSSIPIFTDEAIYLRWSQIMAFDAGLRYLPLVDGKPPLFMWLTAAVIRIFSSLDPLLAGRLVAVGAGLFSLIGVFFTAKVILGKKALAYLAIVLYLFLPFTLFYDRFGLADGLLAGFGVWSLGLAVLLAKTQRLDVALLEGIVIGLGLLTKAPALFFLVLMPLSLLVFPWKSGDWKIRLIKYLTLFTIVIVISEGIYSILRLFPLFHMITQKNSEFLITFSQLLMNPFGLIPSNLPTLLNWEGTYLTFPLVVAAIAGLILGGKKLWKEKIILAGYFLIHLGYMSVFNKSIFPRFLLTFTPVLIILIAQALYTFRSFFSKKVLVFGLIVVLLVPIYTDFKLLTDPVNAPIPDGDSNQYLNRWPAGFGITEIRKFLQSESLKGNPITLGTEGTFGLMPYALQIYQREFPNVKIIDYWPLSDKVPKEITEATKTQNTYFIIYQQQDIPEGWKLDLIASYQQGNGSDRLRLYRVLAGN